MQEAVEEAAVAAAAVADMGHGATCDQQEQQEGKALQNSTDTLVIRR